MASQQRYRRENDDGPSNEYARARQSAAPPGHNNAAFLDNNPSLDQLTDSMELGRGQQELWEEIYKLGVSGVDKYIELPQIVVVGDQSSGKSSVLEAITGVPFPRNSGMCTKFPTQINLRKAVQESRSVALIPERDRSPAEIARFGKFPEMVQGETDLGVIIKRAEQTIWPHGQSANSASKDTLTLDFSGPRKDYLTLVDLPGIIHSNASNVTGDAEERAIRDLAMHYMKNPRSIILAVISAANDLNLQVVAKLARTIDPTGSRTLGVITKPDRIDTPEGEEMFIRLAKNEIVKFDLGWHVLRNRANDPEERNCASMQRDLNEKRFFETSNWNVLDRTNLGIDALRTKMSRLLLQRFGEVIPHVVSQIEQRLETCKKNLEDLGEGYGDVSQMRNKMQMLCKRSTDYVYNAAEGYYRDHYTTKFFDSSATDARIRKLRARINDENLRFEEELRTMGHTVEIEDVHPPISNRRRPRVDGVKVPTRMTMAEFIEKKVDPVIRESAGLELLGDGNPLLVYKLFQKQSENWEALAARHMGIIHAICTEFLREVLDFVWPSTIQEKIWLALIDDPLDGRQRGARMEVDNLCKDRSRYAKSYDREYINLLKKWERKFLEVGPSSEAEVLHSLTQAENYLTKLLAYYEVTSKVFMSNVIVQVVERHLVDDLAGIFDYTRVHDMEDEKIEEIFEEDEHIRDSRARLKAERASLEGGLKSARRLAARKDLKVVSQSTGDARFWLTVVQYDKLERDLPELDIPQGSSPAPGPVPAPGRQTPRPVTTEATPEHPALPSRPTAALETPRERRGANRNLQPDTEPVRVAPVESPTSHPSLNSRSSSSRPTNPYQQPALDAGYSQPTETQRTSQDYYASQPQAGVGVQRPPAVPPYIPAAARVQQQGYSSSGQDAYVESERRRR